jgi:hypothetical protein
MNFGSFATSISLWFLVWPTNVVGLIANPVHAEKTWRIHNLVLYEDPEYPPNITNKELLSGFNLYRSYEVPCPTRDITHTTCGWQWTLNPIFCFDVPPRKDLNETKIEWNECRGGVDGELPKSVSQWLRFRLLDVDRNAMKPKSAKWQVIKATVLDSKLSPTYLFLSNCPMQWEMLMPNVKHICRSPIKVEQALFSADDSMFVCGTRVAERTLSCKIGRPSASVTCHQEQLVADCGFSVAVTTQETTYGYFARDYWAIKDSR